ncbi:MAG TPA: type II CAAX endopeptidase family protein [Planctomycetota bacterium]
MNEPTALPALGATLAFVACAAPLVVLALRGASRRLARRESPPHRWPSGEATAILLLPFVLVLPLSALMAGAGKEGEPEVLPALLGSQLLLAGPCALAVFLAMRRPLGLASLGLTIPPPRGYGWAVLQVYLPGALVFYGLATAWLHVCRAMGWEERQEIVKLILTLEHGELWAAALVAALVGPFLEELLFRGFLQGFMAQVVGERWALVASSALFASLHGVPGLPSLFLLSLFLGWLQLRTRSLWVPYFAHALHNAVSLTVALAAAGAVEGGA